MDVLELSSVGYSMSPAKGPTIEEFNKINYQESTYEDFFKNYIFTNTPCVIKSVTEDWKCQKKWVCSNKPNISYLQENYGNSEVSVANCEIPYYNAQESSSMKVKEFMNYWEEYIASEYPSTMSSLYLKDWHFQKEFPSEEVYRVPKMFASDWLNEFYLDKPDLNDDFRFVYMGPKGTWTPLHSDVFSSYSWSVNICGKKKWIFFPPGEEKYVEDRYGVVARDVRSKDLEDTLRYPDYPRLHSSITLVQEAGDAVFVPSRWYHQVWNLDDTISINQNWLNGCNVSVVWNSLKGHLRDVEKEIENCRGMEDWSGHCQKMLKTSEGINYSGFRSLLLHVAEKRLHHLETNTRLREPGHWFLGPNHMIFDLQKIKPILQDMTTLIDPEPDDFDKTAFTLEKIDAFV